MNNYVDYQNYINNLDQINKNSIAEPYIGFIRGNMFNNLYDEYRNYKPQELNPQNDKEYAKMLLQMYCFAAHDLGLYLDVFPNDQNIMRKRAEYIRMYKEALMQYENMFGTITKDSITLENNWSWDTKKWPWEGND